jgi:hypothetical protein
VTFSTWQWLSILVFMLGHTFALARWATRNEVTLRTLTEIVVKLDGRVEKLDGRLSMASDRADASPAGRELLARIEHMGRPPG